MNTVGLPMQTFSTTVQSALHSPRCCIRGFDQLWMATVSRLALLSAVSYQELEHPRCLMSTGGPGTNPLGVLKDNCTLCQVNIFILIVINVVC